MGITIGIYLLTARRAGGAHWLLLPSALSKIQLGKTMVSSPKVGEKTLLWKKSSHLLVMYFSLWYLWSVKVDSRNSTLFLHLLLVPSAMPQVELASRQKKSRKMGEVTWCYIFSTAMWYYDIMNTHVHLLTIDFNHSWYVVRLHLL